MKDFRLIWVVGFFLLLGGCAGTSEKMTGFETTMRAYEQVIRWGDLEKTNDFLREPAKFSTARHERLKKIQVTGYHVLSRTMTRKGMEQVVEIKYTKDASVVVRTITDVQEWHYDEDSGHWYLASKVPEFK